MKRPLILICALACALTAVAQNPEVTIRNGKAILDEAYYYQLKQRANAYNEMEREAADYKQQLERANAELKTHEPKLMTSFNDSASYAIGKDLVTNWQQQKLGINIEIVAQSMLDILHGKNTWGRNIMDPLLQRFQMEFERNQMQRQQEMMATLETNKAEGAAFLKDNARSKAVYTTASGLQYKILKRGNGKKPTINNVVRVHYTGTLINGTKFDSSVDRGVPAEFPVNAVIPGWTEGLQLMDVGSKYIFYIPYNLAYGEQVIGDIPPGSTLIFEVELLEIVK